MTTRPLTDGERTLARTVFGDSIDYDTVKIHDTKMHSFHPHRCAITPNGEMFAYGCFENDYSKLSASKRAFFIHEMVHVWQFQNNILNPVKEAIKESLKHNFNYEKSYEYTLDKTKDLVSYGMEQQASIVEDHFLLYRENVAGIPRRMQNGHLPEGTRKELYEAVLAKFLADPKYARKTGKEQKKMPPKPSA